MAKKFINKRQSKRKVRLYSSFLSSALAAAVKIAQEMRIQFNMTFYTYTLQLFEKFKREKPFNMELNFPNCYGITIIWFKTSQKLDKKFISILHF